MTQLFLLKLIENGQVTKDELNSSFKERFYSEINDKLLKSAFSFLNLNFNTEVSSAKKVPVSEIYNFEIVRNNREEFYAFLRENAGCHMANKHWISQTSIFLIKEFYQEGNNGRKG